MTDEHSCTGPKADIMFVSDGVVTHRFRRMCDGHYWGGPVRFDSTGSPHMMTSLDWMLRKVAELANDLTPGVRHELGGFGWYTNIAKRMEADRIAGPLGCSQDQVRRFFSLSVEIPTGPLAAEEDDDA